MIDITLTDKAGKETGSCSASLPYDEEKRIFLALREALLNYDKLLEVFGGNI